MDTFHILAQMKTLLVEDDQMIREAIQMAFFKKGCFMQAAESAEEGLGILEKERFDIIISDFRLPGIDGLEFFKKATACQPNTVKALISAYAEADVISQAYRIGVHIFLQKPFSFMKLLKNLTQQIEKRDHEIESDAETKTEIQVKGDGKSDPSGGNWAAVNCTGE